MMLGPFINALSVIVGSLLGGLLGRGVNARLKSNLPFVFGCCSLALGVVMLQKVQTLPPVILAILTGSTLGELMGIEHWLQRVGTRIKVWVETCLRSSGRVSEADYAERFVPVLILFCASGTGIFGAMNEGMTGDTTLLMVKSFLDLFTSAIFAASLGCSLAVLALPQLAIQASLFFGAQLILPLTTPVLLGDFSGCGGIIMLATGIRILGLKSLAVANMLPALFLVMPVSALWARLPI